MNQLQASMRDKSAKTWLERTIMYKVGSPMKGCKNCGRTDVTETGQIRYLSGFQVFRAYKPWNTKWTWKCWECSAIDLACWSMDSLGLVANELGKEPIVGARPAVREQKGRLRRAALRDIEKVNKVKELEAQLEFLKGTK